MGVLMERYDLDVDRAFGLARYSQVHNRKLRDVAQDLIDTRRPRANNTTRLGYERGKVSLGILEGRGVRGSRC
jgi:hypothetical protein